MWATRRMHERGTKAEHLARIAAKNFNNGALNPMSQRQADKTVTVEKVLGSRMVAWPLTTMMSCPIGDGAACAIVGRPEIGRRLRPGRPVVRVLASELQTERYERGHLFIGPVVGPARMSVDTSRAAYEQAGLAALKDAGLSFRDVQAAYVGYIFAPVMSGIRTMKEFGLTGLPVQHVENASATGSAAFREACLAVASGQCDVAMALGFDKMSAMIQSSARNTDAAWLEDSILPAAFFAMWATRRKIGRASCRERV